MGTMQMLSAPVGPGIPGRDDPAAGEYLTFALGGEHWGVDILKVQEIRGYAGVTRIPGTPDHVKGVINLRGAIVPVVDLRIRFRLGEPSYDAFTVMIVLNLKQRVVAVVVDGVADVVAYADEQTRAPPKLGTGVDARYLRALGVIGDSMVMLIDIERLLGSDELAAIDTLAA